MTATTMPIVGYGDRWSVQPGETLRFMVSARHLVTRLGSSV